MSAFAPTVTRPVPLPFSDAPQIPRHGASMGLGPDYNRVFRAGGIIDQAKEGFIAARFSPSQPLRIKRTLGLRLVQSISLPEPSEIFSFVIPWESERECLAA